MWGRMDGSLPLHGIIKVKTRGMKSPFLKTAMLNRDSEACCVQQRKQTIDAFHVDMLKH